MKKLICLFFAISALLLTACVYEGSDDYEFPTGGPATSTSDTTQTDSDSAQTDDSSAPTDESTTTSEIPNDPDDGYSKRY